MIELRKLIEDASNIADICFEPEGQMMAHILSIDRDGASALITCPMGGPTEERMFRVGLPRQLKATGHQRWVFFCEAWTAAYSGEQHQPIAFPRDRADRMEIITFTAEDAVTGERMQASRQIYRSQAGGPGRLLPLVFATGTTAYVIDDRKAG